MDKLSNEKLFKTIFNLFDELEIPSLIIDSDFEVVEVNKKWGEAHRGSEKIKGFSFLELIEEKSFFEEKLKDAKGRDEPFSLLLNFKVDGIRAKEIIIKDFGKFYLITQKEKVKDIESEKIVLATYRIATSAITSKSLNELFSSIHQIISELMDAKNFYIALYDRNTNIIEYPYFVDEYDSPPPPEPLGKNLTSYVIKTGKPLLIDPDNFKELLSKGEVVLEGTQSIDWLGVPLISENRAIGVIAVQSYSSQKRYTKQEMDLLNFVSGQIAIAIEKRRTLELLKENEEKLKKLTETTSAAILIIQDEEIKEFNKAAIELTQYKEEELKNKKYYELLREDYRDWVRERALARLKGEKDLPSSYEVVIKTKSGKEVWLQLSVSIINYQGRPATLVTAFDISSRKEAEFFLRESEERFRTLAETTTAAIFMFKGLWIVYANKAAERLTGYSKDELLSLQLWDLVHPDDFSEINYELTNQMKKYGSFSLEKVKILTKRGEERWMNLQGGTAKMEGETVVIATAFDITQIVQVQDNLKYLAHHDYLTGLENRWAFHETLLKTMEECEEDEKRKIVILFIDLDRFKELNDTEGHILGDKILRAAGSRILSVVSERGKVARIGSDEFTVLLGNSSPEEGEKISKEIIKAFEEPFSFGGREYHITLSIGICVFPDDGRDLETLLKNADMAMFKAKHEGGSTYRFYAEEMSREAKEKLELRNRLFGALERNELALYFQPIYGKERKLVGFEALLRWFDSTHGLIYPDKFIPIAEESGLIVPLGEWVLNVACTHIKNLHKEGYKDLRVAVNLSAKQFYRRDLLDLLEQVLERVELEPSYLELEITERTAVMDIDNTTAMLYALSSKGIRIAIDDFGSGYSSMTYLKSFPINCIKIDRSFIRDIEHDRKDLAIVKSIITMAHGLDLEVVAEGVETEAQWRILMEIGCDHFQGHFFGKAEPMTYCGWK